MQLEEQDLDVLVVNARHVKQIPGRKTDVKDAEWLMDLLRHGLVRGSAIPDRARRELRELVRYRISLVRQRAQVVQRTQKLLEGANIKLSSLVSDITGVTGRAILHAMAEGATDPTALARLARGSLVRKQAQLRATLRGTMGPHQRVLLGSQLRLLDALEAEIASLSQEVADRLTPYEAVLDLLDTIPGVGRRIAEHLVAEIGPTVDAFQSAAHLASWAGVCPGNNESAGKRLSGRTRPGNVWLCKRAGGSGLGRSAHPPLLPGSPVPAAGRPPRGQARGGGGCPFDLGHRVSRAPGWRRVSGPGRELLR